MEINELVEAQRQYFYSGKTFPVKERIKTLKKIREILFASRQELNEAFMKDYNKGEFDVIATEFYMVISEIDYMLKHLKRMARPKRVHTSIMNFPAHGMLFQEPYGVVLIVSPWNYPLQLTLSPMIGAIGAGNTVVVKPSNYSPNVASCMAKMFSVFPQEYISFVLGGREQNQQLFEQTFDYIFFTGGYVVGTLLMEKAAAHLTPISLELGGKSPAIVDEDANIDDAAKRLAWGKFLNAGQTCVAPDHFIVHEKVYDEFVEDLIKWVKKFYYVDGKLSPTFCHVINDKHVVRLTGLIQKEKLVWGGKCEGRALEPTIMTNSTFDDPAMQEEIFGPVLPIIKFNDLDKLLEEQLRRPKPLAFYYFSKDGAKAKRVMARMPYGGGCINDTIMHMTSDTTPFGGVGRSGMGSYHGKKTFETFSHQKAVLVKGHAELPLKFPPYSNFNLNMLKIVSHIKKGQ
ncbi:MAG: aldehyde dehydrogenase family protein [Bacilli bacterium]|jgi:aldehyde dehydrogenase (NAD+)|nr:aldehyde dehydrogenase family protein [Bacilli bacterium]